MLNLNKLETLFFYSLLLFLPVQVGLHFWPEFSYVQGIRIDYLSPTLYLTDILIFVLFLLFVINKKNKHKVNLYFAFFFSLLLLGSLLSQNYKEAFYGLLKFLEFSYLTFYIYKFVSINNLFTKVVSISLIFENLLSIAQFLNKGSLGGIFYYFGERTFNSQTPNIANANINGSLILRPYGTFPHPNVLAAFLLIGVAFILFFAKPKTQTEKLFYYSTVGLSVIALGLTLSRTALIAFIILVIFKLLSYVKSKSIKKIALPIAIFGFLIITLIPFSSRFTSFNFSDESFTQRKDLTIAALSMTKDHPLFGVGLNNFLVRLPEYYSSNRIFYLQPVHNIYLLAFSQTGIVAGFVFLIFLFIVFQKASPNIKLILIPVYFLGFFDHYFLTLQQGQLLLVLLVGLSLGETNSS